MNHTDKKRQLEAIVYDRIAPLIDRDYMLMGLPYYTNIGDTLIWDGEIEFLKRLKKKCVGTCAWNRYPATPIENDAVILITGGGYFGDLWRDAWQEVLDFISLNRDKKIIILPQTIYYQSEQLREKDATLLGECPNLTICVRDKVSLELAHRYFKNPSILVPDMAFCMSEKLLRKYSRLEPKHRNLLFSRTDKEKPVIPEGVPADADVHDWLSMEGRRPWQADFERGKVWAYRLGRVSKSLREKALEKVYYHIFRRSLTRDGLEQLSSYRRIYTTRLHAMILGTMLGRDVRMIDNKFGKLSSYYDTWLTDCDNVSPFN